MSMTRRQIYAHMNEHWQRLATFHDGMMHPGLQDKYRTSGQYEQDVVQVLQLVKSLVDLNAELLTVLGFPDATESGDEQRSAGDCESL